MIRWSLLLPALSAGLAVAPAAEPPAVSALHTVSIHVDNIATYNALLRLWSEEFQWPLLYGAPLTEAQAGRRNYAGIWAGNVRLELCGPYPQEFQPGDPGARLHGLTFHPRETAEDSVLALDRIGIGHKPTATWGVAGSPTKFVIFDDPHMVAPLFSISIMDTGKRGPGQSDRDRAQPDLEQKRGGPLGLQRVREIRLGYSDAATLLRWQRLLQTSADEWPGAGGPALKLVQGGEKRIVVAVLQVNSLERCERVLRQRGLPFRSHTGQIECDLHGVRLLFAE